MLKITSREIEHPGSFEGFGVAVRNAPPRARADHARERMSMTMAGSSPSDPTAAYVMSRHHGMSSASAVKA
ncbi:hypothetical protein [Streptomyces sp. NPDC004528]|uniref:hypothetical protein n=1 Tax=Streptomyces sp. NPDC004528 TaxID=3154550 RepID=UPI0033AA79AA